jgi:hypothetical protein
VTKLDFHAWEKGNKDSFLDINLKSNVKDEWLEYKEVVNSEYKDSIIKPINKYMQKLATPPSLVSIVDNVVTLRQDNFAEVYLLENKNSFTAMEKIHMRQFYLSDKKNNENKECFEKVYRWAMTWFIDFDGMEIKISNIDNSPFYFYDISYLSSKENSYMVDPKMLFFQFKRVGSHMKDEEYGRIKRGQPAFLISFKADDHVIEKVKEFYVSN